MVLTSDTSKLVVLVELLVPWEDRMEEAHEHTRAKYAEIVEECVTKAIKRTASQWRLGARALQVNHYPALLNSLE